MITMPLVVIVTVSVTVFQCIMVTVIVVVMVTVTITMVVNVTISVIVALCPYHWAAVYVTVIVFDTRCRYRVHIFWGKNHHLYSNVLLLSGGQGTLDVEGRGKGCSKYILTVNLRVYFLLPGNPRASNACTRSCQRSPWMCPMPTPS